LKIVIEVGGGLGVLQLGHGFGFGSEPSAEPAMLDIQRQDKAFMQAQMNIPVEKGADIKEKLPAAVAREMKFLLFPARPILAAVEQTAVRRVAFEAKVAGDRLEIAQKVTGCLGKPVIPR
jgi:sulfur carrier protein ThiS